VFTGRIVDAPGSVRDKGYAAEAVACRRDFTKERPFTSSTSLIVEPERFGRSGPSDCPPTKEIGLGSVCIHRKTEVQVCVSHKPFFRLSG
jgi:hypothetical protein